MFPGAVIVFLLTYPFDRRRKLLHLYSSFWAQLFFYLQPLWRLRIAGREHLPWEGPAVLVANHQSLGDIVVLFGLYRPFKWVSKASVFKVPLIGWNMVLNGYVPLERGRGESVRKMMDACRAWLARGFPVFFFPEGTRSRDGQVQEFKDGAFALAVETGCPVIPIAVSGTADILPKHGFKLQMRADCRVRVLPPLSPADHGGDLEALKAAAREAIVAAKAELDRR
ncbi:MAG: lysophospholipid acyltransferase family protein [Deltaproteobacteria bacterium]|nr:lysophospholipid acyltransferase family protein [Deltaproteobacteria bacterium]